MVSSSYPGGKVGPDIRSAMAASLADEHRLYRQDRRDEQMIFVEFGDRGFERAIAACDLELFARDL